MCFALGLGDPAQVPFVTTTEYTRPQQVHNVINGLEKHQVRFVVWYAGLNLPDSPRNSHDNLGPLRAYLRQHYHIAKSFATSDMILERNP